MIVDVIAGIISGMLGAMGLGGGSVLVLYLTMIKNAPQLNAQGINLIFFIPTAISALIFHTKNKLVEWKIALRLIVAGLIGIIPGYYLISILDDNIVRRIFAVLLVFVGLKNLFLKK